MEEAEKKNQNLEVVPTISIEEKLPKMLSPRKIANVIRDKHFGNLELVETDSGWWTDVVKVERLIDCFKNGFSIKQACFHIGITRQQYYYFLENHPEFSYIKQVCEEVAQEIGKMMTKTNILTKLREGNTQVTLWFAEKMMADEYGGVPIPAGDNFGTINNNTVIIAPETLSPHTLERIKAKRNASGL